MKYELHRGRYQCPIDLQLNCTVSRGGHWWRTAHDQDVTQHVRLSLFGIVENAFNTTGVWWNKASTCGQSTTADRARTSRLSVGVAYLVGRNPCCMRGLDYEELTMNGQERIADGRSACRGQRCRRSRDIQERHSLIGKGRWNVCDFYHCHRITATWRSAQYEK